ncbi:metal ABC transporter solute-binding protein, Zn/Mn family [Pelistega ratti]|uniref:metal ABC transporter solute-binding protein, Zn/Mn family n=1 Tax=Pelistega ratti TaxID=2652177 RepID=UPI00135B1768|nr:zinc ABC transporter substrate-binding protein [Pelistega ratti]
MKKSLMALGLGLWLSASAYAHNITVATSFSILEDMVKNVGGEHITVVNILGADKDAHHYEFKPSDVKQFASDKGVKVFFTNGLGMDPWADALVKASGFKGKVVKVSDGVELRLFDANKGAEKDSHQHKETVDIHHHHDGEHHHDHHSHDTHDHSEKHDHEHHHHGAIDPHAWQNLKNAQIYVDNITKALSELDADHAEIFQKNAQDYKEKIAELDKTLAKDFAQLPENHRYLVTSHEALGYFADAYGLKVLTPLGISSDAEPSAKEMVDVINTIRSLKIPTVFLENVKNPKLLEQIAKESGAKIGGVLYTDALSAKGEGSTYLGMIKANAKTILEGLK